MPGISLQAIAAATGAALPMSIAGDTEVLGLGIDSRELQPGELFVALAGEQVDGHAYLSQARGNGAVAALVEREQADALPQLVVGDTQQALGQAAAINRHHFTGKVAAVTGSAGKTTCKNMLASILGQQGRVCATRGNYNNELGVPLTLQRLASTDDYAVIEMGAARAGDIQYLMQLARPDIGVITNIGAAHAESFGGLDATAAAKAEIYQALPAGGIAVVNLDDAYRDFWLQLIDACPQPLQVMSFAVNNASADLRAEAVSLGSTGTEFVVRGDILPAGQAITVKLPLLGQHNVHNALAAIAVACALSIPSTAITEGLASLQAEPGRLQLRAGRNRLTVIDDSYNANPEAMKAAIDVLAQLQVPAGALRVAALGDMGELGEQAADMHRDVARYAASHGVDRLYAIGEYAPGVVDAFNASCSDSASATVCTQLDALAQQLESPGFSGAALLVKGSRFMAMERLVNQLCDAEVAQC